MKHLIDKYLGGHQDIEQEVQHMYYCPNCHHKNPRFSVNYNINAFKCWVCGFSGRSLLYLLYYLDADPQDIAEAKKLLGKEDLLTKQEVNLSDFQYEVRKKLKEEQSTSTYVKTPDPKDSWKTIYDTYRSDIFIRRAFKYLRKRNISEYEINLYDIKFDEENLSIVIPSYDINGKLNYYITHHFDNGYYQNPKGYSKMNIVFNEYHIDFRQPVILTEGVYDSINIGYNCLPMLGTFVPSPLLTRFMEYGTPMVYIFLDGDAEESSVKISKYLSYYDVDNKIVNTPEGEDGNSLSKDSIEQLIESSRDVDFKFLIKKKLQNA